MAKNQHINFGIPGWSMKERMEALFEKAGYDLKINESLGTAKIDDSEIICFFDRAKEIAPLIEKGALDGGIITKTAALETSSKTKELISLGTLYPFSRETKLVLGAPEESAIKTIKNLEGKRIITRTPEITKTFLKKHNIKASVEYSDGNNQAKVRSIADALVEYENSDNSFAANNLRVIEVIMKDEVVIAVNPETLKNKWKLEKIENLGMLLKSARLAEEMVGLVLHASNGILKEVFDILPALKKPTVTPLRGENWFDILTVVNKQDLRNLLPKLKEIGCTDMVEFPLNKVVL
ncbi:ATP phosphoribosyltransferase [Candidatus Jorgensenbacteria bacterium RIFCSPLOWO2_01_FULL_45_25b]|uniref:ATP phosphoribosyltransferase n=1 Tax=Candidatus Jorgensenbacteria bacterium RIFCSPLOWO2_01_FULL_45_25b TaxID=1798471 RepID=A0A1F6BT83_9BACT|nr:MAG: ATP phosphoribosyltransferase [Candidatus Jorgensenbacteria bacterium RIFCSPLOWO2_01_FULL_45_25b]